MPEKIQMLKTGDYYIHPRNVELYGEAVADQDLIDSIKERGILQPLLIAEVKDDDGALRRYIVSGHRRNDGAAKAGLEEVPCILKKYASLDDTVVDLIDSNAYREKTEAQIAREIDALTVALTGRSKRSFILGDNGGENGQKSDRSGKPARGKKTAAIIAERLDMSRDRVEKIMVICSDMHRTAYLESLPDKRGEEERSKIAEQVVWRWDAARQTLADGEVSLSAAYDEIVELKAWAVAMLTDKRKVKDGKSTPKKKAKKERGELRESTGLTLAFQRPKSRLAFDPIRTFADTSGRAPIEIGTVAKAGRECVGIRCDDQYIVIELPALYALAAT